MSKLTGRRLESGVTVWPAAQTKYGVAPFALYGTSILPTKNISVVPILWRNIGSAGEFTPSGGVSTYRPAPGMGTIAHAEYCASEAPKPDNCHV